MTYKLMFPTREMQPAYEAYVAGWAATGEHFVPWAGGLRGMGYDDWLENLRKMRDDPAESFVPSTLLFFADENDRLLGMLDLRHMLNSKLMNVGGHIGYGLHPATRGQGLAKEMLRLGLVEAKKLGIPRALLTCNDDNPASAKTIEACGGVRDIDFTDEDGTLIRRYWIDLSRIPDITNN